MTSSALFWTLIKILVMVGFLVNVAGLLTWYDRRGGAMMQDRIGPNRASLTIGSFQIRLAGLLHTAADGLKFFTKEDFMPPQADKLLFSLAPILALMPVLALSAVIPFGDSLRPDMLWHSLCVVRGGIEGIWASGNECAALPATSAAAVPLTVAPLNVGLLYVFAMAGQGIVGAAIAGWSSDNKFSLMGGLRAASQMVSYEVTMGLTIIGAMMVYGTVRLDEMVRWQGDNAWGIFVQPLAFFLFFAAAIAESKRIPFDLPEAESELVSGYFTEYSGMKFGMFYFAEYMEVVTSSMLLVTIFLGGWELPFVHREGLRVAIGDAVILEQHFSHIWITLLGVVAFFGKTLLICWLQAFIRWSLPRFRYDHLMRLGWTILLPASLANIFVTGVVWLTIAQGGDSVMGAAKVFGDLTQLLLGLSFALVIGLGVAGLVRVRVMARNIVGSSASFADRAGGAKEASIGKIRSF